MKQVISIDNSQNKALKTPLGQRFQMNETQLTTQIKTLLKSKCAYCEKIFGGGYQSSGIPDILCCYKGKFIGIEVKSPTGKGRASDIQKLKIRRIRDAGGIAFITDNLDFVKYVLNCIDNNLEIKYDDKYF